jgi:hypothetical protein
MHLASGLTQLYLTWSNFTDDALPPIAGLTRLSYLQTFGNQFTDAGVQQLVTLQNLTDLYLEESSLTAAAFEFTTRLPRLTRLGLQDVDISEPELAALRSRLPHVTVDT